MNIDSKDQKAMPTDYTKLEQAARQALEALEEAYAAQFETTWFEIKPEHFTALREALAEQEKPLYRKVLREMLDAHEQAEQEPVVKYPGCDYCNDELFCGRKCKCCGKVFIEDEDFVQSEVKSLRQQVAALKAVVDAWNNAEQEPVGEVVMESMGVGDAQIVRFRMNGRIPPVGTKLYASPVRTKDLTDKEIVAVATSCWFLDGTTVAKLNFARDVIAAYKEKQK